VVYKGNLLSFQYKKSVDHSLSMGEIDGLSFFLIGLYVPAASMIRSSSVHACALRLSENTSTRREAD
jgi:hypothetical protein